MVAGTRTKDDRQGRGRRTIGRDEGRRTIGGGEGRRTIGRGDKIMTRNRSRRRSSLSYSVLIWGIKIEDEGRVGVQGEKVR
jgi:hypothetical protein